MKFETILTTAQNETASTRKYFGYLRWVVYCRAFPEIMDEVEFTAKSEKIEDRLYELNEWLTKSRFYTSPASTRYHEAYEGGLCEHSIRVVENIIQLHQLPQFESVDLVSAVLVALVHDWCKIGLYESYLKNVKDDNGNWVKETAFKLSDNLTSAFGHGVSSMYLAGKWFNLSEAESLAIRWHMGSWRVVESEYNELQFANENYPLVHMLQFADQLAIVKYNPINNL